jgi:hypothetical protein
MPGRKCRGHRRFVIQAVPSSEEHRDYNRIPRKTAGDCFISGAPKCCSSCARKRPRRRRGLNSGSVARDMPTEKFHIPLIERSSLARLGTLWKILQPTYRRMADVVAAPNLRQCLARFSPRESFLDLMGGELWLSSKLHTAKLGFLPTLTCP